MLSNLLSNALKFTPAGGHIEVRLQHPAGAFEISVTDSGPGIEPAEHARIFERYQQGDQRDASSPGTGIGLALVRELIALHEGSVHVHSERGSGARFTLRFPDTLRVTDALAEAPPRSGQETTSPPAEAAETVAGAGNLDDVPCVLIVDDNAELRAFLRLRLGRSYRIVEAQDGEAGLAMAREQVPDAIITDGMMPRMDGLAMTAAIKADPELDFVPVLMLTSRAGADNVVRGLQAGADDYLAKPFDGAELAARVAGLIASRHRLRARFAGDAEPRTDAVTESAFQQRIDGILAEHLADADFSVRDWASLLHMDRTTLFRKIKSEVSQSPEEYLREFRLARAASLLAEGAGNVAEVADAVGFASVSYFSRRFRERYQCSPASYARGRTASPKDANQGP
jgi:DNA-binding response OmpR family regulator